MFDDIPLKEHKINVYFLRTLTHFYLDNIWMLSSNKKSARTSMYKWLSTRLNLPEERTHVRYFNKEMCLKTIRILEPMYTNVGGKMYEVEYEIKNDERGKEK